MAGRLRWDVTDGMGDYGTMPDELIEQNMREASYNTSYGDKQKNVEFIGRGLLDQSMEVPLYDDENGYNMNHGRQRLANIYSGYSNRSGLSTDMPELEIAPMRGEQFGMDTIWRRKALRDKQSFYNNGFDKRFADSVTKEIEPAALAGEVESRFHTTNRDTLNRRRAIQDWSYEQTAIRGVVPSTFHPNGRKYEDHDHNFEESSMVAPRNTMIMPNMAGSTARISVDLKPETIFIERGRVPLMQGATNIRFAEVAERLEDGGLTVGQKQCRFTNGRRIDPCSTIGMDDSTQNFQKSGPGMDGRRRIGQQNTVGMGDAIENYQTSGPGAEGRGRTQQGTDMRFNNDTVEGQGHAQTTFAAHTRNGQNGASMDESMIGMHKQGIVGGSTKLPVGFIAQEMRKVDQIETYNRSAPLEERVRQQKAHTMGANDNGVEVNQRMASFSNKYRNSQIKAEGFAEHVMEVSGRTTAGEKVHRVTAKMDMKVKKDEGRFVHYTATPAKRIIRYAEIDSELADSGETFIHRQQNVMGRLNTRNQDMSRKPFEHVETMNRTSASGMGYDYTQSHEKYRDTESKFTDTVDKFDNKLTIY